jgi:hypothetical protein
MRRSVLVLVIGSAVALAGCAASSRTTTNPAASSAPASSAPAPTPAPTTLTPSPFPSTSTTSPPPPPPPPPPKPHYSFDLPSGPTAPGAELLVYTPLRAHDCVGAQSTLGAIGDSGNWSGLPDPSKVLLFQAGIAACGGDTPDAKLWLGRDQAVFKATTKESSADSACSLYRALFSWLYQVAQATVTCPMSTPPAWLVDQDDNPVDPRVCLDLYAHPPASPSAGAGSATSSAAVCPSASASTTPSPTS